MEQNKTKMNHYKATAYKYSESDCNGLIARPGYHCIVDDLYPVHTSVKRLERYRSTCPHL